MNTKRYLNKSYLLQLQIQWNLCNIGTYGPANSSILVYIRGYMYAVVLTFQVYNTHQIGMCAGYTVFRSLPSTTKLCYDHPKQADNQAGTWCTSNGMPYLYQAL